MHQNKHQHKNKQHIPVLFDAVLHYLDPQMGESYLDLTAGYGGHATAVLARTGNFSGSVLVDRDQAAQVELEQRFGQTGIELKRDDFLTISREFVTTGRRFDLMLADLGVSSPHLNEGSRGFAIQIYGPLDMRMDQRQPLTAQTIVNSYSEAELAAILHEYGEEPKARLIARAIVKARPLQTTEQLAAIVRQAWPRHSRVHPATRTFQALRIAVNDELGLLEQSLELWPQLLKPGGRLVIISFHSLEDRLVKRMLTNTAGERYDAELQLLTKKPITAGPDELVHNPRARSAKLRAAVKINTKKGNAHADSGRTTLPHVPD